MRMDKLTSRLQLALADAQSMAVGRDNQFIAPVHVMAALLEQDRGSIGGLLTKAGINMNRLRVGLGDALDRLPRVQGDAAEGDVHISNELNRLLNVSDKLAQQRGDAFVSSELFVLAACRDRGDLGRVLQQAGAVEEAVEKAIDEVRGGAGVDDPDAEESRQALEKYAVDLTAQAEQGKLDPGDRPGR